MTSTLRPSLRDGTSLHRYPGTLCLATINLSLRDKSHSPIVAPLALPGLKSWAEFSSPFGFGAVRGAQKA